MPETKKRSPKKKTILIVLATFVLLIGIYVGGGFLLTSMIDAAEKEVKHAVKKRDYQHAIKKIHTVDTLRKIGAPWAMHKVTKNDDFATVFDVVLLEAVQLYDKEKILSAIDRRLDNGESVENVWKAWENIVLGTTYEKHRYNNEYYSVALDKVWPLLPMYTAVYEKLYALAPDVIQHRPWYYQFASDIDSSLFTSPDGKVIVCGGSGNRIELTYTALLPKDVQAINISNVEYIILLKHQIVSTDEARYRKGTVVSKGERTDINLSLLRASDRSIVKEYGTVRGEVDAPGCSSAPPVSKVMAAIDRIVRELRGGLIN